MKWSKYSLQINNGTNCVVGIQIQCRKLNDEETGGEGEIVGEMPRIKR